MKKKSFVSEKYAYDLYLGLRADGKLNSVNIPIGMEDFITISVHQCRLKGKPTGRLEIIVELPIPPYAKASEVFNSILLKGWTEENFINRIVTLYEKAKEKYEINVLRERVYNILESSQMKKNIDLIISVSVDKNKSLNYKRMTEVDCVFWLDWFSELQKENK